MSRSPASILYDAEGNAVLVAEDGANVRVLEIADSQVRDVLGLILVELKRINVKLAHATELKDSHE